jgi:orotidine-5'-phosphate decarboxylase
MKRSELEQQIQKKQSVLCVGLDVDLDRIPAHLHAEEDPIFAFNKAIIDATQAYAVAYKPNLAFYESEGLAGWQALEKTVQYLCHNYPQQFLIADAKRGDIGNTGARYARAFFEKMDFDAVTVAPYMGKDSVSPFLNHSDKWAIILALTSNPGAADFQMKLQHEHSEKQADMLYERVLRTAASWGDRANTMFVVGATRPEYLTKVRAIVPDHFLLVPGVGAQGGTVASVMENGRSERGVGLLINSSRGIIYAGQGEDFAHQASAAAQALQQEMAGFI